MLDRERAQSAVFEDVDARPVRDPRDGQPGERGQRAPVVERAAEDGTRFDQELLRFLRALPVVDVGVRAEPLDHLAASAPHRHRPRQVPAVGAVVGTLEADLVLVRLPSVQRSLPELHRPRQVVGMHHLRPAGFDAFAAYQSQCGSFGRNV